MTNILTEFNFTITFNFLHIKCANALYTSSSFILASISLSLSVPSYSARLRMPSCTCMIKNFCFDQVYLDIYFEKLLKCALSKGVCSFLYWIRPCHFKPMQNNVKIYARFWTSSFKLSIFSNSLYYCLYMYILKTKLFCSNSLLILYFTN